MLELLYYAPKHLAKPRKNPFFRHVPERIQIVAYQVQILAMFVAHRGVEFQKRSLILSQFEHFPS